MLKKLFIRNYLIAGTAVIIVTITIAFGSLLGLTPAIAAFNLDLLKRDLGPEAEACKDFSNPETIYPKTNNESDLHHPDAWRCFQQKVYTGRDGLSYDLNFLEFRKDGTLRSQEQFDTIKGQIALGTHLVVIYIHGWRHDAEKNDSDVLKFRMMLTYSAQFLKQRQAAGSYEDMKVTGIYVGWPGQSRLDCSWKICNILVAPSLFTRKPRSDRLGIPVVKKLKEIEEILMQRADGSSNRMLVTGHSLGGNMLIRGINDLGYSETAIKTHQHGNQLPPILGDLTVLFNPASEAENWIQIQRAVRDKMNLADPNERFGFTVEKAILNHSRFPFSQKPVLMSLTSACDWPDFVTKNKDNGDLLDKEVDCDTATGKLFPLFRTASLERKKISKTAIGHLAPSDACVKYQNDGSGKKKCSRPPDHKLFSYGTTHELEVQVTREDNNDRSTTYQNALQPLTSTCHSGDGWLAKSKRLVKLEGGSPNYVGWDTGYLESPEAPIRKQARAWVNRELGLNVQFRHQIYRGFGIHGRTANYNITFANDPFWNVRALDTAVRSHGGFHSYPVWCSLHQIVLDDIYRE